MNEIENKETYNTIKILKYKFISFLVLVIIFVTWGYFFESFAQVEQLKQEKESFETQITEKKSKIKDIKDQKKFIEDIKSKKSEIISCLNNDNCNQLDDNFFEKIIEKRDSVRGFYMLSNIQSKKMDYNQKRIVKNIYEFLFNNKDENSYGDINIISFGDVQELKTDNKDIYTIDINLNADFDNKEQFFNFLSRVEKEVDPSSPVYYTVSSVNYNIVGYEQPQTVSIGLNAYFY